MTDPVPFHQSHSGTVITQWSVDAEAGSVVTTVSDWLLGTFISEQMPLETFLTQHTYAQQKSPEKGYIEGFAAAPIENGQGLIEAYYGDLNNDGSITWDGRDDVKLFVQGTVDGVEQHKSFEWVGATQSLEQIEPEQAPDFSAPRDVLRPENWIGR